MKIRLLGGLSLLNRALLFRSKIPDYSCPAVPGIPGVSSQRQYRSALTGITNFAVLVPGVAEGCRKASTSCTRFLPGACYAQRVSQGLCGIYQEDNETITEGLWWNTGSGGWTEDPGGHISASVSTT